MKNGRAHGAVGSWLLRARCFPSRCWSYKVFCCILTVFSITFLYFPVLHPGIWVNKYSFHPGIGNLTPTVFCFLLHLLTEHWGWLLSRVYQEFAIYFLPNSKWISSGFLRQSLLMKITPSSVTFTGSTLECFMVAKGKKGFTLEVCSTYFCIKMIFFSFFCL